MAVPKEVQAFLSMAAEAFEAELSVVS